MDSLYIDNLDEFINDEKKLVSYKWLSLTLKVSSNIAKQMLFDFVDKHQKSGQNDTKLHVTYLVSGIAFDDNLGQDIYKMCVVRDSDLAEVKSNMKKIVSIHIYSVQRANPKDLNILYAADYDIVKEDIFQSTSHSSITFTEAHRRSCEDILKPANQLPADNTKQTTGQLRIKSELPEHPEKDSKNENKENKFNENNKLKQPSKPEKVEKGKGGIANMFSKLQEKSENKTSQVKPKNGSVIPASKKSDVKQGMFSTFFTKAIPKEVSKSPKDQISPEAKCSIKEEVIEEVNVKTENVEEVEVKMEEVESVEIKSESFSSPKAPKVTTLKKAPIKTSNSKSSKKKSKGPQKGKRKSDSEDPLETSKRRRIMIMDSSSESESDNGEDSEIEESPIFDAPPTTVLSDDDDDDVIPSTPKESGSISITSSHRGRKRKLVDKTFMDDDGFFVTKKEYVLVSDSDNEDPIPMVKEKSKISPVKKEGKTSPVKKEGKTSPVKKEGKSSPVKKEGKTSPVKKGKSSPVKKKGKSSPKSPKKAKTAVKKDSPKKKKKSIESKQSSITSFFKRQ